MQNLLFLAHRIPYPPNKGDKIRSYHFLKHLSAEYNVYLGTFIDEPTDWQYTHKIDDLCVETHFQNLNPLNAKIRSLQGFLSGEALSLPYYKNKVMQDWVDIIIKQQVITKVLIFSSVMAQFINASHPVDMLVDFVDVDSDKWRQYSDSKSGVSKWVYQRESTFLLNYEKQIAEKAKMSFFVSEQEAALFKTLAPQLSEKVSYVNNGVDTDYFSPEHKFATPYSEGDDVLVFTGAMDYWANVDAVKWFAETVIPGLIQSHPNLKFYIVGSRPAKEVLELAENKNIIVTGAVDDVRPYLAHSLMAVAPLRIARGIQNKVLEAMAMGKYIIATSAAMEGIPHQDNLAVLVADEVEELVKQINLLLLTQSTALKSNTNRDFVKAEFSWHNNVNRLSQMLQA